MGSSDDDMLHNSRSCNTSLDESTAPHPDGIGLLKITIKSAKHFCACILGRYDSFQTVGGAGVNVFLATLGLTSEQNRTIIRTGVMNCGSRVFFIS